MRPEFKFGLITGIILCGWIAAEHFFGLHATHWTIDEPKGYFSIVVPIVTLLLLLRRKQTLAYDDLPVKHGVASGLMTSFVAALIVYGFLIAYNQWINPDWIDNALAIKVAALRDQEVDEMEIRREITSFRDANGVRGMIAHTLLGLTLVGGIISAPLTLLVRAQPRQKLARDDR